jgi:DNA-binding FadR family transcriptional regulator
MKSPSAIAVRHRDGTLTRHVADTLRGGILSGDPGIGEKLPSEAQLIDLFKVSRTVVREALSTLRAEGLVEPRQGAGVFVVDNAAPVLRGIDPNRVSSVVEGLELRTAIEVEAAYLAAARCSPVQEETIIRMHREVGACIAAGRATVEADLALHLAIAEASNNRRFVEILKMLGREMIPRAALDEREDAGMMQYMERLHEEHRLIVDGISNRDQNAAREAMRSHLVNSQKRYRAYLYQMSQNL